MMKKIKSLFAISACALLMSSCTKKIFYTNNCDAVVTNFEIENTNWKDINGLLKKYRCVGPEILEVKNGIIVYRSLPRDQQLVEGVICEYWKNKYAKIQLK